MLATSWGKRSLLLCLIPIIAIALLLLLLATHHTKKAAREASHIKTIETPPGGRERAKHLSEIYTQHGDRTADRIDKSLKNDPTYGKSLLEVDQNYVMSLKGLSTEEKIELWKIIQATQERERKRISTNTEPLRK